MSYKMNYSAEEKIKLAKDDSVEKLYESKKNQRTVRVLTVLAYMLTVSLAALILSFYYVFLWKPSDASAKISREAPNPNAKCDKIIIPENIAIQLANHSQVSVETFIKQLQKLQAEAQQAQTKQRPKMLRSEFNNYLAQQSSILQNDVSVDKKIQKKVNKKKRYQDDEDLDMESSGHGIDKALTTSFPIQTQESVTDLNETTIIFDQEPDE